MPRRSSAQLARTGSDLLTPTHLGEVEARARRLSSPGAHAQPPPSTAAQPSELRAAIADEVDPLRVITRVVDAALALLEHAQGCAVELDNHAGQMVYVCAAGSLKPFEGLEIPLIGSLSGFCVTSGRILQSDDTESDPRVNRDACRRVAARSMVCVPLKHHDEAVGVLKVSSSQASAFTPNDVTALEALSDFIASAIGGAADLGRASGAVLIDGGMNAHAASGESVAKFVAHVLRPGIADDVAVRTRVERVLAEHTYEAVFQPIVAVETGAITGVEALSRFRGEPARGPDAWFADARAVGLGVELDLATAGGALAYLEHLPAGVYMSINASPQTVLTERFAAMCTAVGAERLVVELTEHSAVDDYPDLTTHLQRLRRLGVRLAIDDTGAGISSLAHILKLSPDVIKLDRSLTSGIDIDPARRSLATALVAFAAEISATIVAEGVETAAELAALRELGITMAQGFYLAKPAPFSHLRWARLPV